MDEKRLLRAAVRRARGARPRDAREAAALTRQLARLTEDLGARRVATFVSVNSEPNTAGYLDWALEHGVDVLLPRVVGEHGLEWAVHEAGALAPGAFGILEPTGPAVDSAAGGGDLLLIPAAAVDRTGTRLGWGRGYFDRELARILAAGEPDPAVFAVVYEDEVLERIPAEAHDIPVHGAVTEERIHRFG